MQGSGLDLQSILTRMKNPYEGVQPGQQQPSQQRSFYPQNANLGQPGSYQNLAMLLANQLPQGAQPQLQQLYQPPQPAPSALPNLGMGGIPPNLLAGLNKKQTKKLTKWGLL